MSVSIEQIKELRDATGISMMACKKALEGADGDFEVAVAELRKKGEAKAADRSARATGQGVIVIKSGEGKCAMVRLGCETDFVSRGDDFVALANSLAEKTLVGDLTPDSVEIPEVKDSVLKLGENITADLTILEGDVIGTYVHSNSRIGVLVSLEGGNVELANGIAMHAAATNPSVISPDEISDELVTKEKEIWIEQLRNEGKPEEIMEKIMIGKEKKFREESALLKQAYVKDSEKTIEGLLAEGSATLKNFVRFAI